jgi:hypothetical protein
MTLMMEALRSSETTVLTRATRRNVPEDAILHRHCRENLKSYISKHSLDNNNYNNYNNSYEVTNVLKKENVCYVHWAVYLQLLQLTPRPTPPSKQDIAPFRLKMWAGKTYVSSSVCFVSWEVNRLTEASDNVRRHYKHFHIFHCSYFGLILLFLFEPH